MTRMVKHITTDKEVFNSQEAMDRKEPCSVAYNGNVVHLLEMDVIIMKNRFPTKPPVMLFMKVYCPVQFIQEIEPKCFMNHRKTFACW